VVVCVCVCVCVCGTLRKLCDCVCVCVCVCVRVRVRPVLLDGTCPVFVPFFHLGGIKMSRFCPMSHKKMKILKHEFLNFFFPGEISAWKKKIQK
jgi:hypothetical protein